MGSYGTGTVAPQNCHILLKNDPFLPCTVPPNIRHQIIPHFSQPCRNHLGNLTADGRIILKLILNYLQLIWLRIGASRRALVKTALQNVWNIFTSCGTVRFPGSIRDACSQCPN